MCGMGEGTHSTRRGVGNCWTCTTRVPYPIRVPMGDAQGARRPPTPDTITGQPECASCGGACCQPERLEFPWPVDLDMGARFAQEAALSRLGLPEGTPLGIRINEHGRRVMRVRCLRRGRCREKSRPLPCLRFPLSYLDADHSDAERAEIAEFCALFRRLQEEVHDGRSAC